MGRAEISWKKRTEEGEKREVYAKHVGDQWLFYSREKRFDDWEPLAQPPLDDWLELLDGVRRRIGRRRRAGDQSNFATLSRSRSMNSAPTILIAPSTQKAGEEFYDYAVSLSDAYSRAVIEGGGIPFITPCAPGAKTVSEMVAPADGILLSGGDDIQPKLYWEDVPEDLAKTSKDHDPQRDLFETVLINEVFRQRKPMLAICRGHQMVNVALGGTLIVDLP